MAGKSPINSDLSMEALMRRWPQTIAVVLEHRMFCVGCPITEFHTIADACMEHEIDEARLIAALEAVITSDLV
jgi:hybrid cluster-associated redox disulfide protein